MGTTIRTYGMTEADIRGERFKDAKKDLLNNGDLFSLTQPEMICDIHRRFLEAGADIIETNTFGATSITQSEFFVDDPREHGGRKDPGVLPEDHRGPVPQRPGLGDQRAVGAPVPRVGRSRRQRRRHASASSPAPSGRSPCRSRTRPTPTTPASAWSPSIRSRRPTSQQVRALIAGGVRRAAGRDDLRFAERQGGAGRHPARCSTQDGKELPIMISAAVGRGGETMISAQTVEAFWNAVEARASRSRSASTARSAPT